MLYVHPNCTLNLTRVNRRKNVGCIVNSCRGLSLKKKHFPHASTKPTWIQSPELHNTYTNTHISKTLHYSNSDTLQETCDLPRMHTHTPSFSVRYWFYELWITEWVQIHFRFPFTLQCILCKTALFREKHDQGSWVLLLLQKQKKAF